VHAATSVCEAGSQGVHGEQLVSPAPAKVTPGAQALQIEPSASLARLGCACE